MEWHNEDGVDGSALPLPVDNVDVSRVPVCAMADNFRHHWMTNKEGSLPATELAVLSVSSLWQR